MGRKSNEQKRKEEFERLTGAIAYNKKDIEKDIDEYSWKVATLGYKEAKTIEYLKDAMSMLEISNKRLKELETVEPTEESFGKWFEDNFLNWKRKEIKNIKSIKTTSIIGVKSKPNDSLLFISYYQLALFLLLIQGI